MNKIDRFEFEEIVNEELDNWNTNKFYEGINSRAGVFSAAMIAKSLLILADALEK